MTDWLLELVPTYGLWLIAATTLASCLALPIPASIIMLAAGGFTASGDLVLGQVIAAALFGAVLGDQIGYFVGRFGGGRLIDRVESSPKRAAVTAKARALMQARGGLAVFLSRWLFSPLGPYINLIAGAVGHGWRRFTLWGIAGEAVWCGLYVSMGRGFGGSLAEASDMLGSVLGLIAAGTVMVGLGAWLVRLARADARPPFLRPK